VTVRHLLTHTSGYSYDIFNAQLGRYIEAAGLRASSPAGSMR